MGSEGRGKPHRRERKAVQGERFREAGVSPIGVNGKRHGGELTAEVQVGSGRQGQAQPLQDWRMDAPAL